MTRESQACKMVTRETHGLCSKHGDRSAPRWELSLGSCCSEVLGSPPAAAPLPVTASRPVSLRALQAFSQPPLISNQAGVVWQPD